MLDVNASKGILVSNAGFTKGAKKLSMKRGIDLCSLHDAETRDWKLDLKIPMIWEEITPEISVSLKAHFEKGDSITQESLFTVSGENIMENFSNDWAKGKVPIEKSEFVYNLSLPNPTIKLTNNKVIPIDDLCFTVKIARNFRFGFFDQLPTAKALKNESSDSTEFIIPIDDISSFNRNDLVYIESPEDAPVDIKTHIRVLLKPDKLNYSPQNFSGSLIATEDTQLR